MRACHPPWPGLVMQGLPFPLPSSLFDRPSVQSISHPSLAPLPCPSVHRASQPSVPTGRSPPPNCPHKRQAVETTTSNPATIPRHATPGTRSTAGLRAIVHPAIAPIGFTSLPDHVSPARGNQPYSVAQIQWDRQGMYKEEIPPAISSGAAGIGDRPSPRPVTGASNRGARRRNPGFRLWT